MTLVRGVRVESDDRGISASVLRKNKEEGTAEGYRRAAIETGWTYPGVGIFDADDPLLAMYVESSSLKPFEKHLPDADSPYGSVPRGGFITGKEAIEQRGIDLRLFYDVDREEIKGLVRFDEGKTSIGPGYSVHGGGISAVLDEATAEAGKMMAFPYLATRRITHEMKKPVPSGTTLVVWTEVKAVKGCACALPMLGLFKLSSRSVERLALNVLSRSSSYICSRSIFLQCDASWQAKYGMRWTGRCLRPQRRNSSTWCRSSTGRGDARGNGESIFSFLSFKRCTV